MFLIGYGICKYDCRNIREFSARSNTNVGS